MGERSDGAASGQTGTPATGGRRRLLRRVFWVWAVGVFVLAGSLALAHDYALPKPLRDEQGVRAAVAQSRRADEQGRWLALHVLYSRCRCSERTLAHLFARGPRTDVSERIVLVGAHASFEQQARAAGFVVEVIAPEQLQTRYQVEAAPLFIVADPEGSLRYVGGYTERKQSLAQRDVVILDALRQGGFARELPLFGCAVSRRLQALFDPFGLKSRNGEG
jgi:hypothetical protein